MSLTNAEVFRQENFETKGSYLSEHYISSQKILCLILAEIRSSVKHLGAISWVLKRSIFPRQKAKIANEREEENEVMGMKWRQLVVVIFAAAMAWVESSVVVYMRLLIPRLGISRQGSFQARFGLEQTELVREAATLIMLFAIGWLAGRTWRDRLGYTLLAFGVWDITYYVFLIPLTGWPRSPLDWDLLFLIPLPWWGPVLAPISISGLMVLLSLSLIRTNSREPGSYPGVLSWGIHLLGILLALYVFMAESIRAFLAGLPTNNYRPPPQFDWPIFVLSLVLIASPIFKMLWQSRLSKSVSYKYNETNTGGGTS